MNTKFPGNSASTGKRAAWSRVGATILLGLVAAEVGASQPPDPTSSDSYGNTAGGSTALLNFTPNDTNPNEQAGENTAFGLSALYSNTAGGRNTGVGATALYYGTTGFDNTAVGQNALRSNGASNDNTAVGSFAMGNGDTITGSNNIALGAFAGESITSGSNNIEIGSIGCGSNANTICLGTAGTQTATYIAGISGVTVSGGADVVIGSNGQLGTVVSSAQYKRDIQDMGDDSARLAQLRPVTFHYKADPAQEKQYGLIAEEVAQVYPDLVVRDQQGKVQSVQYHALVPMLLNEQQRQQREVQALKDENAGLRTALQMQQARLTRLEQQVTHSAVVASR